MLCGSTNMVWCYLIGTLRDDLVGEELIADYLLFTLNQQKQFGYVKHFKLNGPNDSIEVVLAAIAKRIGALLPGGVPNIDHAARYFIGRYRDGKLGKFQLS